MVTNGKMLVSLWVEVVERGINWFLYLIFWLDLDLLVNPDPFASKVNTSNHKDDNTHIPL